MNPNERNILVLTSIAHLLTHFFVLIFPALMMPITRDLGLKLETVIPIGFLLYILYGALAIPAGFLSDLLGGRWIMSAGLFLSGCGFFAAGFAQSTEALFISFGIVGIGCAAYHPAGLALLSKGIRQRGKALGINGLCGNIGIALSPFAAGILNYFYGWKTTLFIIGFLGIVSGLLCLLVTISVDRDSDAQKSNSIKKKEALTAILILCIVLIFSGLLYRGFTIILPSFMEIKLQNILAKFQDFFSFLQKSTSTTETKTLIATTITSCVYLIGMWGQILGGKVADRFELRRAYLTFFTLAMPFLICIIFLEGWFLVIAAGGFAFFTLGMQPIENSLVAMITPPRWRSISYGVKFTLVFGVGAFAVKMVSITVEKYNLDSVIYLLVAMLSMVILTIILLILFTRKTHLQHVSESD